MATLLAARGSMRLRDSDLQAYRSRAQRLTRDLPDLPAAVPLYVRGKTRVLALDFDARHCSADVVITDVRQCLDWIGQSGGRAVVDRSTSGGCHVLVPLPIDTEVRRDQIEPILRLLATQLDSLDITPMLNPSTGCITPPGSRTREGGFRILLGSLDDAVDAFTIRSAPGFLARLTELLASLEPRTTAAKDSTSVRTMRTQPVHTPRTTRTLPTGHLHLWEGDGKQARLRAQFRLQTPMPRTVRAFAVDGTGSPDGRWRAPDGRLDRSAARQSVLTAAVLRGYTLADIHRQLPPAGGDWAGLWASYDRYGKHGASDALHRDWAKVCSWAARNAPEFLPGAHKIPEHTGGWRGEPSRARKQTEWLAAATMWVDAQWPGSPRRHTILALLQGLAHASVAAGGVVRGVPVVEVGGRSLSIMACLSETTVWQLLRDLRDLPGSPILRIRRGAGVLADQHALVLPSINGRRVRPGPTEVQRARIAPVHEAWSVIGLHCRRLYDAVAHCGLTTPADAIAAAKISRSAGYSALASLTTAGLLNHRHGQITVGPVHLDRIALAHNLPQARMERIAQHKRQRAVWHAWLLNRFGLHTVVPAVSDQPTAHNSQTESAYGHLVHQSTASAYNYVRATGSSADQLLGATEDRAAFPRRIMYPVCTYIDPTTKKALPRADCVRCAHSASLGRVCAHIAPGAGPAPP
ncbi:hypothetical protein [Nocardia vaccinii]|uniref:hypothetical protein n=1 Tax=Nocardia vaccinii TaxID=1822 RepID=UPI0012F4F14F|nr:hypothetical protein [Nocardia vaccinii]